MSLLTPDLSSPDPPIDITHTSSSAPASLTTEQKTRIRYLRDHAQKVEAVRTQQTIIAEQIQKLYNITVPISQIKPWGLRAYGIELKCTSARAQPFTEHWKKWSRKAPLKEMLETGEIKTVLLPGVVCPDRPPSVVEHEPEKTDAARRYQEFVESNGIEVRSLEVKLRPEGSRKRRRIVKETPVGKSLEPVVEVGEEPVMHQEEEEMMEDDDIDDDPIQRLSRYFATRAPAPAPPTPQERIATLEAENGNLKQRLSEIQLKDDTIASLQRQAEQQKKLHSREVSEKDGKIKRLEEELVKVRGQIMELLNMRSEYTKEVERQIHVRWGKEQEERSALEWQLEEEKKKRAAAEVRTAALERMLLERPVISESIGEGLETNSTDAESEPLEVPAGNVARLESLRQTVQVVGPTVDGTDVSRRRSARFR